MAGIYLHIPFCKQKCHYCNFYSVASSRSKDVLFNALLKEIDIHKDYLEDEILETIYFGGGTPSVLSYEEINRLFDKLAANFIISEKVEITFEANPDDLSKTYLKNLRKTPINRLSIGVQSFFQEDLKYLNRIHSSDQAYNSIQMAQDQNFQNISIDLIYGIPSLSDTNWYKNLEMFFELNLPHLSAYALTVEPKTALEILIKKRKIKLVEEKHQIGHFNILLDQMKLNRYIHYEISNFCKESFYSEHNKNYWFRKKYLGIGPSAHSFNGDSRHWNVSNIQKYIASIMSGKPDMEIEELSLDQKYNEYILTSLRTIWGVDSEYIQQDFGSKYYHHFTDLIKHFIKNGKVNLKDNVYQLTDSGKLFADGIASELFI